MTKAFGKAIKLTAGLLRPALPLAARESLVHWVDRRRLPGHFTFSTELLRDVREQDPNRFHRFLWSHHLAYAETYEIGGQFGAGGIDSSRRNLLDAIEAQLRRQGISTGDIKSVLDIGCSLGYLLRYAETERFPAATILRGLDIDRYAVETGSRHLQALQSKVQLMVADMTEVDRVLVGEIYDVIFCCGVLMYVDEPTAAEVVRSMLRHARHAVGIICLAHPERDNAELEHSEIRQSDGAMMHNLEWMVEQAGGKIVYRDRQTEAAGGRSPAYTVVAVRMSTGV